MRRAVAGVTDEGAAGGGAGEVVEVDLHEGSGEVDVDGAGALAVAAVQEVVHGAGGDACRGGDQAIPVRWDRGAVRVLVLVLVLGTAVSWSGEGVLIADLLSARGCPTDRRCSPGRVFLTEPG